ncbi:MAG: shikimate dehydrogenase [Candidatus Dormibacteraeota bacterium]|nr:shikimate dehydrogenase [Candidatus Dormibacteraeota bacterium]
MADPRQRVVLIGGSVQQSLSAALQNAGFRAAAIDCRYEPHDVSSDRLAAFIDQLRGNEGILGANVTIPHKEAVIPLVDEVDAPARAIGAVNTISRSGQRLLGSNTDGQGFLGALAEIGYDPAGKTAVIIGAGGAARAVVTVLKPLVDRLWVVNRTVERAERLCAELGVQEGGAAPLAQLDRLLKGQVLVVNATPTDVTLPPENASFLFDLRSRSSITGRLMLLYQGMAAFEIWTGRRAPMEAMRQALMKAANGVTA